MSTEDVLQHHLESVGQGDLDEAMRDYTEETVVFTPEATLKGSKAIRALFEKLGADVLSTPNFSMDLKTRSVDGEIAYIVWSAESDTLRIPVATDTFIVRDDKIVSQTFAAYIDPKS